MSSTMRNISAYIKSVFADAIPDIVAAGAGDATESDGIWIDRDGFESCELVMSYETVLALAETLSFAGNIQDADDSGGTNVGDFGTAFTATVVETGDGSPTSTKRGTFIRAFNLHGARRWLRSQITPDLSASGTDTAEVMVLFILGGAIEVPVP